MRQKINKLFFVWDFDKEEKWLNEMAAKGLALVGVGFCKYEFEDCEPGEYTCRMELLEHRPDHPESRKHIAFIEEIGAEQVGSYGRWVYFRKKKADGEFELYSDLESRLKQLSLVQTFLTPIAAVNLASGLNNIHLAFLHGNFISGANMWAGIINVLCTLFILIGIILLHIKKKHLKKEHILYES